MSKFLDEWGVAHLWNRIKQYIDDKFSDSVGTPLQAGDGTTIEDGKIIVDTPVQGMFSQAEFDALPEEQKGKGLYMIPGGVGGGGAGGSGAGEVYSTEETRIGTWIDGKPLYRKVFEATTPSVTNQNVVIVEFPNVDKIIRFDAISYEDSGSVSYFPQVYRYNNKIGSRCIWYKYGQIAAQMYDIDWMNNCPLIIIFEYTKTTDEEGTS